MEREKIYEEFENLDKKASQGGGLDKIEKQHESGRMTARERIDMLLDKGTFNELDKFVTAPVHPLRNGEKTKFPETVWLQDTEKSTDVWYSSMPMISRHTEVL